MDSLAERIVSERMIENENLSLEMRYFCFPFFGNRPQLPAVSVPVLVMERDGTMATTPDLRSLLFFSLFHFSLTVTLRCIFVVMNLNKIDLVKNSNEMRYICVAWVPGFCDLPFER